MEYKIKNLCDEFGFGVSKFYKLKNFLDKSIPEQNRIEYYYNKGRNFYITEKGYEWFKNNLDNYSKNEKVNNNYLNSISIYQNEIIEMYKKEIEYLKQENKRLLDIISVKEQKELAKDFKQIGNNNSVSFWDKLFNKFKKC